MPEFSRKYGKRFQEISGEAGEILKHYRWKGNVRELRNVIERSVLIEAGPELTAAGLAWQGVGPVSRSTEADTSASSGFPPLPDEGIDLEALGKHYLREALLKAKDNDRKAANLLGLSYYAFRYRKKQLEAAQSSSSV